MNIFERSNRPARPSCSNLFLAALASGPCIWPWRRGRLAFASSAALLILVMAVSGFANPASAQCLANEIQKLTASDASLGDHFGTSVRILGDLAVVGAHWANVQQYLGGAVYIFERNPVTTRWNEQHKLVADDPGPQDEFGTSLAINPVDPKAHRVVRIRSAAGGRPDGLWERRGVCGLADWSRERAGARGWARVLGVGPGVFG